MTRYTVSCPVCSTKHHMEVMDPKQIKRAITNGARIIYASGSRLWGDMYYLQTKNFRVMENPARAEHLEAIAPELIRRWRM